MIQTRIQPRRRPAVGWSQLLAVGVCGCCLVELHFATCRRAHQAWSAAASRLRATVTDDTGRVARVLGMAGCEVITVS